MSSGYVPLFASLTTGTLCGRWPDVGLWPIVLSLADRHGVVDVTCEYLAHITGLGLPELTACMRRFCEADPGSRSVAEGGARLVLIDPDVRDWGWRVVNHARYRERARKAAFDADRTASGHDAARKRQGRESSRDVPTCPALSREVPLSNADLDADKTKTQDPRPLARTLQPFHQEVIGTYHELLPELPPVKAWTKKREQALNARIRERCKDGKRAETVEYWRSFFQSVRASDFLCGRRTEFRADLEWLLRPENFLKVVEGRYDGHPGNRRRS